MTDLPDPLAPPDCDLRGLPFMPLQVVTLMDSDLFIRSTGDEFKAAVALWCKSWNQIPGGSLPNDDVVLADLSRAKNWKKVKTMALRGWFLCSDGRLYHKTVAENVVRAWESRGDFQEKLNNKESRQERWRARVKDITEQLRAIGITPPAGTGLKDLETLLDRSLKKQHVDAYVDGGVDGGVDGEMSTRDKSEMSYKGKGKGKNSKALSGGPDVGEILDYLNEQAGKSHQHVDSNLKLIAARLEKSSVAICKAVIDSRVLKWKNDPTMSEYLRPSTLFNATKFTQYVGELGASKPAVSGSDAWREDPRFKGAK